jgi:DNA-binding SARP family transcriptional activator
VRGVSQEAAVRFAVLGPLLVLDDSGREYPAMPARQRTVLAALLVRANLVVPVDELVEFVWDGRPPSGATTTVRSYVMRLRQALEPAVAARIVTRDPGYLCRTGADELDLTRFEALCRDAGARLRERRWAEASEDAARALALWRGTPLVDVPSEMLREQVAPRLEQLRLQAVEDRIEAELQLGRHDRLVPELEDLRVRHPLRERFQAQLMLALARGGRQAEALEVYRDARQVLVGELGLEPGPELRRLQERILAGDEELAAPPAPTADQASGLTAAGAQVPRQLPAGVRYFTGRQAELGVLTGLLDEPDQADGTGGTVVISALDGMAGIGKTALAVHAAHRLAVRFPGGQLFIDLHGYTQGYPPRSAGEALEVFLHALGVAPQQIPQGVEERAALYRQRLADTKTLIVLDNATSEAQVRPLLPGTASCLVLITSRKRLKGLYDAHPLALDLLPPADAISLLRTVAGPRHAGTGDPALAEIAELCGRLPLALRIAAALLRHRPTWTLEYLAGLLRDQTQGTNPVSGVERDLEAVFDLSYSSLTEPQRHLFRRLGLVPGPDIDAYAAAALISDDLRTATRLLEDLVDHNLLPQPAPGRYRLHDLLRTYARTLVERDPLAERAAAIDRLLTYYQYTVGRADALIAIFPAPDHGRALDQASDHTPDRAPNHAPDFPDAEAAWAWLRTERSNLLAALQYATIHGDHPRIVALTTGQATLMRSDVSADQAVALHLTAAASARRLGAPALQARTLADLGDARTQLGDRDALRELQEAGALYQEAGEHDGQAAVLNRLGEARALMGDYPGALPDLREALRIYRELGDRHGQATALLGLGQTAFLTGNYPDAVRDLQEAIGLYRELADGYGQANAQTRLGEVRRLTGDYAGAAADLAEALQLSRDLGHLLGQANALTWLGEVRGLTGDHEGALRDLREALQLHRDQGRRHGEANTLAYLGRLWLANGDVPGALRELQAALDLYRLTGAKGSEAWALNPYAAAVAASGDHPRALTIYRDALDLARETEQPDDEAHALEGVGECLIRAGDVQAGTADLNQALEIFRRLTMRVDVERVEARFAELGASPPPKL